MTRPLATALAVLLAVAAFLWWGGGPLGVIPGGELSGEEASASSWSEVVSESGPLDLETRPDDPYSVRINFVFRDGDVYIDPAEGRQWYEYLLANPSVRVRIDGRVYRARAVPVTDQAELVGFDRERRVYRLELVDPR